MTQALDRTQSQQQKWRRSYTKVGLALTAACILATSTNANAWDTPIYQEVWEQDVLSGLSLGDKQFAYYQMTISERYFTGGENLAIRAVMDSFGSDPDLFISRVNTKPTTSLDSEWYCVKKGSDTCILKAKEISTWDVLYIGIRCINPCDFTLASDYFTTTPLAQNLRTQVQMDGHSSHLFEYYVPQDATDGFVRAITFTIESEDAYNAIDVYFSLDNSIYVIEERKMENIISNGVGYYFTENDYGWCTRCYVYYYVEVTNPGRYYVTGKPSARNPVIAKDKVSEKFVNNRQQDCFQYFVQGAQNDLMLNLNHYEGEVEFYISGNIVPSGLLDTNILLKAHRAAQMQLIVTAADRLRFGTPTGLYEVCIYGFEDSSVAITPSEVNSGGRYTAQDSVLYTINVPSKSSVYFTYTQQFLNQLANITVKVNGLSLNTTANQLPPRVFYKVCQSDSAVNCFLTANEANGTDKNMTEIMPNAQLTAGSKQRIGQIAHDPKVCKTPTSCFYLISIYYPDNTTIPMRSSFFASTYLASPQSISMDDEFRNILLQGQYFYYQLQPGNSVGSSFLNALTISIENLIGDADLVVSTTVPLPRIDITDGSVIASRSTDRFDGITLLKEGSFSLNRTIYIGVYAQTYAVYQLKFTPVYSMSYELKLDSAVPLNDSSPVPVTYLQEYEESFFSYFPWWADSESRTIVLVADVIFNNIFFYAKPNDFPQFYTTDLQDRDNIIAIPQGGYKITDGFYIRARPDFALYDLISQKQYIFNFIAFSQVKTTQNNGKLIDLACGESQLGYANASSNFYRHYLLDRNSTLNITVDTIIGNPAILIKMSNTPAYPVSVDPSSYDIKVDSTETGSEFFRIDPSWRYNQDVFCDRAGYQLNGGNMYCTIYIAVECPGDCVYRVTLQMEGRENLNATFTNKNIPIYITSQNYYTGKVVKDQIKYFYYPVNSTSGDTVIFLNKTGPLGKNGDTRMFLSVQGDAGVARTPNQTNTFDNWFYPNKTNYRIDSATNSSTQPEIIELCPNTYYYLCGTNTSCVLVIGVIGQTANMSSNFRLIAYSQSNKLYDKNPIEGQLTNVGDYDYYWFSSNASYVTPSLNWEHIITASVDNGGDVDLFISAIDARYPTSEDYDFKSDKLGPDDIQIKASDDFWDKTGYNRVFGIVFVVGVKAMSSNVNYTLMMTGPSRYEVNYTVLQSSVWVARTFAVGNNNNTNFHVYRWYNWGQRDFKVNVDIVDGAVQAYMNIYSEKTFQTNGYLAIPLNTNNSRWQSLGISPNKLEQRISKDDPLLFCYNCWYYITVRTNLSNAITNYRISVTPTPDGGEDVMQLVTGQQVSIILPATGSTLQRKFLLDSKEPFTIEAQVNTGKVNVYVSLAPGQSLKSLWSMQALAGNTTKLAVKTSDANFQLGAFYYVILNSADSKVDMKLTLNQQRKAVQLQSNVQLKDLYYTTEERLKYYYLQVPKAKINLRTTINIKALTSDFYPTILVSKNVFQNDFASPWIAAQTLVFPNLGTANYSFGDNFTQVANLNDFTYSFNDYANTSSTYFAIAVYSWSFGLTDMRKHEFRITVTVDPLTQASLGTEEYEILPAHEEVVNDIPSNETTNTTLVWTVGEWIEVQYNKVWSYFNSYSTVLITE